MVRRRMFPTSPRRLLLYEFAAGDAFPLMGIKDWAAM